jgi:protein-S-isoprenylcysteine O-methyltransferase Ste14
MNALKLKIPPPIYALGIAYIMWLLNRHFPVAHFIESPWNKIGIGIILIALLFDVWSILLFFKKRTTPNPMKPSNASGLVTEGLYKISRNPMYVVMIIMLVGYGVWLGSVTPFLVIPLCYWVITEMQIKPEEKALGEKFGKDYQDYKNSVRRWL